MSESKLKHAALSLAADITLKSMRHSPERCARNLMELGLSAYPSSVSQEERDIVYESFKILCKKGDAAKAKDLFLSIFK